MYERLAASLLTLTMLVTSAMTGGVAYLCLMDGQVRSVCCCKTPPAEAYKECARVERANDCCEVRVTEADLQPARVERTERQTQSPAVVATLPIVAQVPKPASRDANPPLGARGPPETGPPLFVRNCSYLI